MRNILTDVEEILDKYQKIGILISGGLDSSLLAYLLHDIKYKTSRTNTFEFFVVPRPDDSVTHVNRVVDYIDHHFNQTKSTINVVGSGDVHHSKQVTSGIKQAIFNYDCDIYVNAITTNPPVTFSNTYSSPTGIPYQGPVRVKSYHPKLIDVFWDYTKKDLVKVIKDYDLTEMSDLTHSCAGSKSIRCNACWPCCERAWAFAENNFTDTGIM